MQVHAFASPVFGTNCYVVAGGGDGECLVVDPGIEVVDTLAELLREHHLRPAAVLLTHGHVDHTYSVTPVCGAHGVAAYVHADDAYRLKDPLADIDASLLAMLEQQFGKAATWRDPDDVVVLGADTRLEIAGLVVDVDHAPGHTEGSVLFELAGAPEGAREPASATVLSGDVLFAGSIGRTDRPGGDSGAMQRSLREKILPRPDDTLVLPGHGPATTIGRERAANPFLQQLRA